MKITAILNTHGVKDLTLDTLESISRYMTSRVLLVVDGLAWKEYEHLEIPAYKLKGFNHGWYRAPYRNIILGLNEAIKYFPDTDWFCYLEYDCLVGSSGFQKDLQQAEKEAIWCLGNSFRRNQKVDLSFVEKIIKAEFSEVVYLLGSCVFYHKSFIKLMSENGFFEKFLFFTNEFKQGFFPNYTAHDLTEHLMPTMVMHHGGKIKELAAYSEDVSMWTGNYRKFPIRYKPELPYEPEYFLQASVMHPLKVLESPIREFHRLKRNSAQHTLHS